MPTIERRAEIVREAADRIVKAWYEHARTTKAVLIYEGVNLVDGEPYIGVVTTEGTKYWDTLGMCAYADEWIRRQVEAGNADD